MLGSLKNNPSGISKKYTFILAIIWTVLILISIAWNIYQTHVETEEKARIEARTIFEHNMAYRRWNTMHGGIYAPVTEKNQPNPYIVAPNRDVVTTNGMKLTLINPFRMTRQAYERFRGAPARGDGVSHYYERRTGKMDVSCVWAYIC